MAEFDVFLAHNSKDKSEVQLIAAALRRRNLKPWIDDDHIPPGKSIQYEIQQALPLVKSAAIFIGVHGLGRWQVLELESLISQCVDRNIPVIPVLLPGVNQLPKNLIFLDR
ncbi:MAG: toll/interleukin-1 receptor domain-containing protein [Nostoc sp. LLA-1]|nr:toll/interleukin-1 receptor domain-containing protein [Cyanocohniella sp. LLY]